MSVFEEDGFVLVTKEEVVNSLHEDDVVSISSSRSSLCLVEEPSKESSVLAVEEEAPAESAEKETSELMERASATAEEKADEEQTERAQSLVQVRAARPLFAPKFSRFCRERLLGFVPGDCTKRSSSSRERSGCSSVRSG